MKVRKHENYCHKDRHHISHVIFLAGASTLKTEFWWVAFNDQTWYNDMFFTVHVACFCFVQRNISQFWSSNSCILKYIHDVLPLSDKPKLTTFSPHTNPTTEMLFWKYIRVPDGFHIVFHESYWQTIDFYQFRLKIRIDIAVTRAFRFVKPVSIWNYLTLPQENSPLAWPIKIQIQIVGST